MEPLVSVVIPTYNRRQYICDAIDSVLAQTYNNIEIIIVDDGSTDDTRDVLQQYGSKIRYVFQNNGGTSAARNTGIRLSSGEMIASLDSDDIWMPRKLKLQVQLMQQHEDVGMVSCGGYKIDSSGTIIGGPFIEKNYKDKRSLLQDIMVTPLSQPSKDLIRRECFDKIGLFDKSLRGPEDWQMQIRIAKCYRVKFVEEPLVMIRVQHGARTSKNIESMKSCKLRVAVSDLYSGEHLLSMKARSHVYARAAWAYLDTGNRGLAFTNALRSVIVYPLKACNTAPDRKYRLLARCMIPSCITRLLKKV